MLEKGMQTMDSNNPIWEKDLIVAYDFDWLGQILLFSFKPQNHQIQ